MPGTASWKWHHWWSVTQLRTDRQLYYPGYQKTVSRPPPPPLYLLVHNLSSHPNFPPYISNKKFLSLQLNSFVCSQWEILIESLQNFQSSVFEPLQTAAHFSDEKFIEPSCRLEVQLNRKREIEAAGWIVSTATAILLGKKVNSKRWSRDYLEKFEFTPEMTIIKQNQARVWCLSGESRNEYT